jgi:hypothetical protein
MYDLKNPAYMNAMIPVHDNGRTSDRKVSRYMHINKIHYK